MEKIGQVIPIFRPPSGPSPKMGVCFNNHYLTSIQAEIYLPKESVSVLWEPAKNAFWH